MDRPTTLPDHEEPTFDEVLTELGFDSLDDMIAQGYGDDVTPQELTERFDLDWGPPPPDDDLDWVQTILDEPPPPDQDWLPPDADFFEPVPDGPPDDLPPLAAAAMPPPPEPDRPPPEAIGPLLAESAQLSGVEAAPSIDPALLDAMRTIGLAPQDTLQLDLGDAPFYQEESQAAFWFGVLQPDRENPDQAIAGVLSITGAAKGDYQVAFAPCTFGDLEHCQQAAHRWVATAEDRGLVPAFEQAHTMSLDSQLRQGWYSDWGTPLPTDPAQQVIAHSQDLSLDL